MKIENGCRLKMTKLRGCNLSSEMGMASLQYSYGRMWRGVSSKIKAHLSEVLESTAHPNSRETST